MGLPRLGAVPSQESAGEQALTHRHGAQVVTAVHDEQVLVPGTIPAAKMMPWDVPVDIICTPTRVLRVSQPGSKPTGILWDRLS